MPVAEKTKNKTARLGFRATADVEKILTEIAAAKRWSISSLCEYLITAQLKLMMAEEGYSQEEIDEIA